MSNVVTSFETYLLTEKCVAKNTFHAYKRDVYQYISYLKKHHKNVESATRQDVRLFLGVLKKSGLASSSMARKVSVLKLFYNYLHERHNVINVGSDLIIPKIDKKLPRVLSENEVLTLFSIAALDKTFMGLRNQTIIYLLYVSGMRITELVQLMQTSLHVDVGQLRVHGKGDKHRIIPLPDVAIILLKEYVHRLQQVLLQKKIHTDYLFPVLYKKRISPISRQSCWMIIQKLWKKTGSQHSISPHVLRHSLATHLLKNGVDLRSLQLLLGHETITTVQVYTHVETSYLQEIYNKKHPRS